MYLKYIFILQMHTRYMLTIYIYVLIELNNDLINASCEFHRQLPKKYNEIAVSENWRLVSWVHIHNANRNIARPCPSSRELDGNGRAMFRLT